MTKILENPAPGQTNTIQNDKYRPKFKTDKEKAHVKLKLDEKKMDSDPGRIVKKEILPESTKSQSKPIIVESKPAETIESQALGEEALPEEPKKPRYFPPRRLPNPFESAAQEQERFIQARKDALAKYSNISKNRFKQDENAPFKYVLRPGNNSKLILSVLEKSGRLEPSV